MNRRHEFWTADVRYLDAIDEHEIGGRAYVVSVLENHSRAILASALTPTQDLFAFLSVLYRAVQRYGSLEALVTDSGSIFLANQARAVYGAAGVAKHEIARGKPWQNYIETAFNIQRRMAQTRTQTPLHPRAARVAEIRVSARPWPAVAPNWPRTGWEGPSPRASASAVCDARATSGWRRPTCSTS